MSQKIVISAVVVIFIFAVLYIKFRNGRPGTQPEHAWQVKYEDHQLFCTYPDQTFRVIAWNDLISVEMETNDKGPLEPDVFWILKDSKSTCKFPNGAVGEKLVSEKLFSLTNFNHKLYVEEAALSTQNRTFLLWTK